MATIVLSVVGLFAGVLIPALVNPSANLGPLLGIFITFPIGFILGLTIDLLSTFNRWEKKIKNFTVSILAALIVIGCLTASQPSNPYVGEILQGKIIQISPPFNYLDELRIKWEKNIQINPQKTISPQWFKEMAETLQNSNQKVITLKIQKRADIYRKYGKSSFYIKQWKESSSIEHYLVDSELSLNLYLLQEDSFFLGYPKNNTYTNFPPKDIEQLFSRVITQSPIHIEK